MMPATVFKTLFNPDTREVVATVWRIFVLLLELAISASISGVNEGEKPRRICHA